MTKFSGPNDPGFKAVSGRLWLWIDEIDTASQNTTLHDPDPDGIRQKREKKFAIMRDFLGDGGGGKSMQFGHVDSGGGAVFQRNRDVHANINSRNQ